jgi:hypothetical protein
MTPVKRFLRTILWLAAALLTIVFTTSVSLSAPDSVQPQWAVNLPASACPANPADTNCHYASPVLYDLTGDGYPEIIVATNAGHVVAVRRNGVVLWSRDTAPFFNMAPGTQKIHSSPAVGDIDDDGFPDIVVGVGSIHDHVPTQGGIIALDHQGNVKPGWPKRTFDHNGNGYTDSIFGTVALGDLTKDGRLEIIAGGFDKRIYAWRFDGSLLPGFPVDSFHRQRFPDWGFTGKLADSIWGAPALADINGDGYLEIIIGTDEGNFDARWGGDAGGWTCPYTLPAGWAQGYCGGALYVVNRFGQHLPGFPKYILEIIQSTPIVADITGDGFPEIFVGTGNYYYNASPDRPTHGFRVFGWDRFGNDLPGWAGGKVIGGTVPGSPAMGDITGDGIPEIVVGAFEDKRIYAWKLNGQPVSGFPMTPRDWGGHASAMFAVGSSVVLADYTGNGRMEIFINQGWGTTIVNGQGQQLTSANHGHDGKPFFNHGSLLVNVPAIGDLNGNGRLQVITQSSQLKVWALPNSSNNADWPMFKRDAERTSAVRSARLVANPHSFVIMHQQGQAGSASAYLNLRNSGELPLDWTLNLSGASGVAASKTSGSLNARQTDIITITIQNANRPKGHHEIGTITLNSSSNDPISMPILLVVGDISHIHLPTITR